MGEEGDGPAGGMEGEGVGEGLVEGGLPPARGVEGVEGPPQTGGGEGGGGVHDEEGDLLAGEGREGALAAEGEETAVVGEHLELDAGVFLGEGDEVGDIAEGVVLALAGGTEN